MSIISRLPSPRQTVSSVCPARSRWCPGAKLGYAVRADHWGHGYATDAARVITEYGFRVLSLHRITAAIGPDNEPSIAVVKKLGFRYEGRLRDHVFTNNAWRDSLLFSALVQDCE